LTSGWTPASVIDQLHYQANTGLFRHLSAVASQMRLLTPGGKLSWVKPLSVQLVLPPTTEELIRYKGQAAGFDFSDAIEDPVVWISGRIAIGSVSLS
jgi:hypothetical protein